MARVFALLPQTSSGQVDELLAGARRLAADQGLPLTVRRTRRVRVAGDGWERRVELITPQHAAGLYRELHRAPTLVLAFGSMFVRRDPSRDPPVRRAAIRLQEFVAYKASFSMIRGHNDVPRAFSEFSGWQDEVHCSGEADPRVLPLQVFALGPRNPDLATTDGAAVFREQHGPPSSRTDGDQVKWKRADKNAFHGGQSLAVAGCDLPAGLHWDVSRSGRSIRLTNSSQVWRLTGRRAYLNIYPNSYVRAPNVAGVRRVWP